MIGVATARARVASARVVRASAASARVVRASAASARVVRTRVAIARIFLAWVFLAWVFLAWVFLAWVFLVRIVARPGMPMVGPGRLGWPAAGSRTRLRPVPHHVLAGLLPRGQARPRPRLPRGRPCHYAGSPAGSARPSGASAGWPACSWRARSLRQSSA